MKMTAFTVGKRCIFWHRFVVVLDNGFTKYKECKDCFARSITQPEGHGYQPVDIEWVTGAARSPNNMEQSQ